MKTIHTKEIIEAVKHICIETNCVIDPKIYAKLNESLEQEESPIGTDILRQLIDNAEIARDKRIPLCQDTGTAVVFVELGQEVAIEGGGLTQAINEGVRQGYKEGYLRKSIVKDPFFRENTGDNTPAVIHYELVEGDKLKIWVAPKGGGSENTSRVWMLSPSEGIEGVKKAVVETVRLAGPNPCPPVIVGVGIGGNFEKCAILSKKALLREIGVYSEIPHIRQMEAELLKEINATGVGAQGLGGSTTALSVAVETYPCHIASLPVAVNTSCHVTRHGNVEW